MLRASTKHQELEKTMPGTMTAPTFATAASYKRVSLTWMDNSGDEWTAALRVPIATTAAAIDTMVADIVERSNATLWKTELTEVREGAKLKANATTDPRSQSVFDHVFITFKNLSTGMSQRVYIPAPLEVTLQPNTDTPDNTDLADLGTSALVVLGAGYAARSSRYTETREINEAEEF